MTRFVLALLFGGATLAWADPAQDLAACQVQVQQAQNARTGYVAKLAEMLAETREQLDQARAQLQALSQEVARLKAAKPEDKK